MHLLGTCLAPHTDFNAQGLSRLVSNLKTPFRNSNSSGPKMVAQGPHKVPQ